MTPELIQSNLQNSSKVWCVTGVAGFIGSHIAEFLLKSNQQVIGLDNLSTGKKNNIDELVKVAAENKAKFEFVLGDIVDRKICNAVVSRSQIVLHQAALGSVPRSIENPEATHSVNVDGFYNILLAARAARIERLVYASSSSVYGDNADPVKSEDRTGNLLSPYAASKKINEIYADTSARVWGLTSIGLRYFNVFGKRQDPDGPYAAVIPRWLTRIRNGQPCVIYGDGKTSRDFCPVINVVLANILAATASIAVGTHQVVNIACGDSLSLNDLHLILQSAWKTKGGQTHPPIYEPERPGDIRNSQANISKAKALLGYTPTVKVRQGLEELLS